MTEPGLLYGECYAVHFTGDNAIILFVVKYDCCVYVIPVLEKSFAFSVRLIKEFINGQ